jgi:hypothetical protein
MRLEELLERFVARAPGESPPTQIAPQPLSRRPIVTNGMVELLAYLGKQEKRIAELETEVTELKEKRIAELEKQIEELKTIQNG